jgi:hypothetical protein
VIRQEGRQLSIKSSALVGALGLALAAPGIAAANPVRGTVLQLDRKHHVIRVVENARKVESFHYRGNLPRKVRNGSVVGLRTRGHTASRVRALGRAKKVQFVGRIVRSAGGKLTVSLPDGRPFDIGGTRRNSARLHAAGAVAVNIEGLQPGQTVLVTVSYAANGDLSISIKLIQDQGNSSGDTGSGSGSSDGSDDTGSSSGDTGSTSCGDPTAATGKVTGINHADGLFTVSNRWSDDTTYGASPELLNRINQGDEVLVRFDPNDSSTATDVRVVTSSVSAVDPDIKAADGTVNRVSSDAHQFVVVQSNHSGSLTVDAPCWILNQVWQSEDVHLIYHRDPSSGDLVADAVGANDGSEF